ncbi:MAG TPA: hypothetical protein VHV75_14000 [Solirubrobacteraceae bacterium]|jgi:hypothetical protein|nr:hypothetical protein [Solirubrobacteraceae bacterium]
MPAGALAAGNPPGQPAPISAPPGTPVLVPSMTTAPTGFRLTGEQVLATAQKNPVVIEELKKHPHLVSYVYTRGVGVWQVSWFTPPPKRQIEMLQLYVSDQTGEVTQVWTGYQVAWTMARGYPGAFGRKVNALYVWLPLCALFFLPFMPWRRRPTLWHLDLLMLLGFSASLAWFNNADLGLSVPAIYPFMLYLLVRMLLLACGRGRPREPLRVLIPTAWLAVALIFLIGFRVGLNVTNSNVIDVGYAGVIGADKIIHGEKLYGHWPSDNPAGDTYGPVDYYAYVPFRLIFGWSGTWDNLPAAHAASITFDLLTMLGLLVLGWSVRGPTAGVVLAYLWASFPFTSFVLMSNSNDALVALLVVAALLSLRFAALRGVMGGFAGLTKFAPLGLAPLLWRGVGRRRPGGRATVTFVLAYALAVVVPLLPVILSGDWHWFWNDSISYQAGRPAPFSIWGLWGGYNQTLHLPEHIVLGAVVALGLAAPFWPRGERTVVEVAALGAAILIGLQLGITYWFYLYIVWFFPLVVIALVLAHPPSPNDRGFRNVRWRPSEREDLEPTALLE